MMKTITRTLLCASALLFTTPSYAATVVSTQTLDAPKVLVVAGGGGGAGFAGAGRAASGSTAGVSGTGDSGGANGRDGQGGSGGGTLGQNGGGGAGLFSAGGTNSGGSGGQTAPGFSGGAGSGSGRSGGFGGGGGAGTTNERAGRVGWGGGGGGGGYSGGGGGGGTGEGAGGGGGGSFLDASLALTGSPLVALRNTSEGGTGASGFVTITNLTTSQVWNFDTSGRTSYTFGSDDPYSIVAAGAQGGNASTMGGVGALLGGSGVFTAGTTLELIVGGGGVGSPGFTNIIGSFRPPAAGGGGGTFVFLSGIGAPVVAAVPEPATWAMMLVGFGRIGFAMRRRRSKVSTAASYA